MLRPSISHKRVKPQTRRCQARDPFEPASHRRIAFRPGRRTGRPHPLRAYRRG